MPKEYRVEKIMASRINKGRQEYQIKWQGYPMSQCTWQPEEHLQYCLEMVREFNKKKQSTQKNLNSGRGSQGNQGKSGYASKGQLDATESSEEGDKEWSGKNKGRPSKAQKTVTRTPRFTSKKQQEAFTVQEDQGENDEQIIEADDQKVDPENENDTNQENIHILGLHSDQSDNIYFKIRKDGIESNIPRGELIKLNIRALLEFYEEHLEFEPINSTE